MARKKGSNASRGVPFMRKVIECDCGGIRMPKRICCERCARLERDRHDYTKETCGSNIRRIGVQDLPRSSLALMRIRCDEALKRAGTSPVVKNHLYNVGDD